MIAWIKFARSYLKLPRITTSLKYPNKASQFPLRYLATRCHGILQLQLDWAQLHGSTEKFFCKNLVVS